MTLRSLLACVTLILTAACGSDSETPSAEQDREMNEAADMLDKAPDSLSNIDEAGLQAEQQGSTAANSGSGE